MKNVYLSRLFVRVASHKNVPNGPSRFHTKRKSAHSSFGMTLTFQKRSNFPPPSKKKKKKKLKKKI